MTSDIRQKFAELSTLPDSQINIDEAALLIAAEDEDQIDVHSAVKHYLAELDHYADSFNSFRKGNEAPVTSLVNYIHGELSFSGNISDYYDPANSYLNRVIENRRGIPISLALIHLTIGSRLDLPVCGISFPGHFLVKYKTSEEIIVDPFSGRKLSPADCQTLLRQIAGPKANLKKEYFDEAGPRHILIRMLDNLKQIFWREKRWDKSKACLDRQLLLLPDRDEFTIQLGAVYEMQGDKSLAQHTYTQVLQMASDKKVKDLAAKRLLALEGPPPLLH